MLEGRELMPWEVLDVLDVADRAAQSRGLPRRDLDLAREAVVFVAGPMLDGRVDARPVVPGDRELGPVYQLVEDALRPLQGDASVRAAVGVVSPTPSFRVSRPFVALGVLAAVAAGYWWVKK